MHAGPPPADHHLLGEFTRWTFSGIVQTMPLFFPYRRSPAEPRECRTCYALRARPQGMSLKHHANTIRLQWQTHSLALRVTVWPTCQHRVGRVGPVGMVGRADYLLN